MSGEPLRRLDASDERDRFIADLLGWVHEAGNPYYEWFFGGADAAAKRLESWMRRASSEVAIGRVRAVLERGRPVAGFIAMSGRDVAHCRRADTLDLLRETPEAERNDLRKRVQAAAGLFAPVSADEFYLSKMGVASGHRGRGLGTHLVEQYVACGRAEGFTRFRLDVSSENAAAIRLYTTAGFRVVDRRERAAMEYLAMALER